MRKIVLPHSSALMMGILAVASCTAAPPLEGTSTAPSQSEVAVAAPVESVPVSAPESPPVSAEPVRSDFWFNRDPKQGGLVLSRAPTGVSSVALNGKAIELTPEGFFLMGFGRDAAGGASLSWSNGNGQREQRSLSVGKGKWKIEHVNVGRRGGARSSAAFQRRRAPELAQIHAARAQRNESDGWRQDFIWPVRGRLSGLFGSQRIYRGTPGSYHSGMDIAAPRGTPFVAPADGVVILAAKSPFTLEGNLLMIDHGMGLNSAFLHCSSIAVEVGQTVKQGQVIGRVGSTGRATGPHLHWGMKWESERVDPLLLVPQQ